jgi:hypothetical protein
MGRRDARKEQDRESLRLLVIEGGLKEDVLSSWMKKTGRHKSAFFDRRHELDETLQRRYESLPDRRTVDAEMYLAFVTIARRLTAKGAATPDDLRYECLQHGWDGPIKKYLALLPSSIGQRFCSVLRKNGDKPTFSANSAASVVGSSPPKVDGGAMSAANKKAQTRRNSSR